MSTVTARLSGLNSSLAVKGPCRVATSSNVTRSGFQTIDGVLPVSTDSERRRRVLLVGQTNAAENGIYVMDTGTWSRAKDFDDITDIVAGTRVRVSEGVAGLGEYIISSTVADNFILDTDSISFSRVFTGVLADMVTLTLADDTADYLQVYDTSDSAWKKVLGQNLGFTAGGTGGQLRGLQSWLRERSINIKDYVPLVLYAGIAAGTNTTDLGPYINEAIDAAYNQGVPVVYGGIWSYLVGTTVLMRPGVALVAHLKQKNSANLTRIVDFETNSAHRALLIDGEVDGNASNNSASSQFANLVYTGAANDVVVRGVYLHDAPRYGVIHSTGLRPDISNNRIEDIADIAVVLSTGGASALSIRGRVVGNRIKRSGQHTIAVWTSDDCVVLDNIIDNTLVTGMVVTTSGTAVTWVSGTDFTDLRGGHFLIIGGAEYYISSKVSNTALTLATLAGSQTSVAAIGGAGDTISVESSTNPIIARNRCAGGVTGAIAVSDLISTASCRNVMVCGNVIDGYAGTGVGLNGYGNGSTTEVRHVHLLGNSIRNCGLGGSVYTASSKDGIGIDDHGFIFKVNIDGNVIIDDQGSPTIEKWLNAGTMAPAELNIGKNYITGVKSTGIRGAGFYATLTPAYTDKSVLQTGTGDGNLFELQAWDTDAGGYLTMLWTQAGMVPTLNMVGFTTTGDQTFTKGSSPLIATGDAFDLRLGRGGNAVVNVGAGAFTPNASDGAALGTTALMWSDLFLASGSVINWNNGDVTLTHAANQLSFAGASSGYYWDAVLGPSSNDGAPLGSTSFQWSDLFLASGGVLNWNSGNYTLTHSAGALTAAGGPFTAPSFIPSASTVPTNGMYLPAANTLGFAVNSAGEVQLTGTALSPITSDGNALGTTALMWADLFLAAGGVINWSNGDVTVTHSSDLLAFAGAASGYTFDSLLTITSTNANAFAVGRQGTTNPALFVDASAATSVTGLKIAAAAAAGRLGLSVGSSGTDEGLSIDAKGAGTVRLGATSTGAIEFSRNALPTSSDGAALGTTALMWSDLFLASGGVINFNNGDVTLTHSSDTLTLGGGSFVVSTGGIKATSGNNTTTLNILSGNDALYTGFSMGRTGVDFRFGIVGQTSNFISGTAVGDSVLNWFAGATLWFGDTNGVSVSKYTAALITHVVDTTITGVTGLGVAISSSTWANLAAGTTAKSSLRFIQGVAPTAPVDGDVWREDNTNTGLKVRINGVTKTVTVA